MPQPGVNGKLIVDAICETRAHPDVYYVPQQDAIPGVLKHISERGDLVLTLGAGDISQVRRDAARPTGGSGIPDLSSLRAILISAAVAVATTLTVLLVTYLTFPVTGVRVEGARMFPESEAWTPSRTTPASLPSTPSCWKKSGV